MTTVIELPAAVIDRFLVAHRLPDAYRDIIDEYLLPLAGWVADRLTDEALLLGVNGAQGTGKSTLSEFLGLAIAAACDARVAVLSIDDFYLTKHERQRLAETDHALLGTRGVPGTHDVCLLENCLASLAALDAGESMRLPRFDKASDDRADVSDWPEIQGPVDLIILEGWCVGSVPQPEPGLREALNDLERTADIDGRWRRDVNEALANDYAKLFAGLDALVLLRAPSFEAVYRWRVEQEHKLAASNPDETSGIMSDTEVAEFIQHYERITRHNLAVLPEVADVVLDFDENHACVAATGL
jgi:D-glycerate 3-kinase